MDRGQWRRERERDDLSMPNRAIRRARHVLLDGQGGRWGLLLDGPGG